MAVAHCVSFTQAQYHWRCRTACLARVRYIGQGGKLTRHSHRKVLSSDSSRKRQHAVAAASGGQNSSGSQESERATESILGESDSRFFLKLLFISFAGAAVVKYGSLLLDTPFQPNLNLGLTIIAAPCLAFAIWMWSRSLSE